MTKFTGPLSHRPLKLLTRSILCLLSMLTAIAVMTQPAHAAGNSYYLNCSASSNGNGSQGAPWNTLSSVNAFTFSPGDTLYLQAGSTCTGQLHPGGSGSSDSSVITITTYGGSGRARIDANGTVNDAFLLDNQQYWEVNNLELTNTASTAGQLTGADVVAQDSGTLHHIHLSNLYVHDVSGIISSAQGYGDFTTGGIVFQAGGSTTQSNFDDVLVTNCTIHHTDRLGIVTVWSSWSNRGSIGYGSGPWVPSTRVVVQNNTIDDTGADGVLMYAAQGAVAQYNTVSHAASRSGAGVIGMFTTNTDNTTFQYNEVWGTGGGNDSTGFDCDYVSNNCVVQYNYTHDNQGGFITFYGAGPGTIVRDNISQNDGANGDHNLITFANAPSASTFAIYNNSLYVSYPGGNTAVTNGDNYNNVTFTNNIFSVPAGSVSYATPGPGSSWDHNLFYTATHPSSEPNDPNKLTSDPLFANAGGAGTGISTASAYRLQTGSPALRSGVSISNNGGQDFFGNAVASPPNRGAYQGQGVGQGGLTSGGTYIFTNQGVGKCMDNEGASWNGSGIWIWDCQSGNTNQAWTLNSVGNGNYLLVNKTSGKCLDNTNGSSTDGNKLQEWDCNSISPNQTWSFTNVGNGYYQIVNQGTGKCADNSAGGSANGNILWLWDCQSGNQNQAWSATSF